MNSQELYSIRMHASCGGRHVSGAERIVAAEAIESTVNALIARSRSRNIQPDRVTIHVDSLAGAGLRLFSALDVITLNTFEPQSARSAAARLLRSLEVSSRACEIAMTSIRKGAAPSGANMRGAMIIDSISGERLERDRERGVRASRFDWSEEACRAAELMLSEKGLTHFRTREALALATKVVHAPGVIAELCWSDDHDYTAGYVASLKRGYVRFPVLKQLGERTGGRAIFVDSGTLDMDSVERYLQEEVVLITGIGTCRGPIDIEHLYNQAG